MSLSPFSATWRNDIARFLNNTFEVSSGTALTWTPVLTFATPGDLTVAYTNQIGTYVRIGDIVWVYFNIITSTFTHGSASGNLQVTGLPFTVVSGVEGNGYGAALQRFRNITLANYTQFSARTSAASNTLLFDASGQGQNDTLLTAAELPTGGTVRLIGELFYRASL